MKQRKFRISALFYNNRFVLIFSIFLAIILWFIVASLNTSDRPRQLNDIPVSVTLSEDAQASNLKVFSQSVDKVKVSIRGDSVAVHSIDPANLKVVAEGASSITQPTSVSLRLKVEMQAQLTGDYSVEIEPSSVFVDVDYYKEVPFTISKDNIVYKANSAYLVSEPALSTDMVTISGPEKEIDKIAKVTVDHEIKGELISTQNFTESLTLYDKYGEKISSDKFTMSTETVDVTITVLSRQYSALEATFTNQPEGLVMDDIVTVEPESIQIAGPKDVLSNFTSISLEAIDFTEVSPANNTFQVDVTLPPGCRNISMIHEAEVTLDLSGFTSKRFTLQAENFKVRNLTANKTSEVYTKTIDVTLIGPSDVLENLKEEDIVANIDMSGKESFTGHIEMPVTIEVTSSETVWAYGSYQANVEISDNTD